MFKLFQSIFEVNTTAADPYPDWLVERATERAIDGMDTRLRVVSAYGKKLRPGIIKAIDHVVKLVDGLPEPVDASPDQYGHDPYITAYFASANDLQQFFSNNRDIREYLDTLVGPRPDRITGLLMMKRIEKKVFGTEMSGDILLRDVLQVTVSFDNHQMMDPNGEEEEMYKSLKRRAFDHLITLALHDVIAGRAERQELEKQQTLLRRKLKTLQKAGWRFDIGPTDATSNPLALETELNDIETQLEALPAKTELLDAGLDTLIEIFNSAPQRLWSIPVSMIIDRMNIKRDSASTNANELLMTDFHSANGDILTGVLVSYPTGKLLPPKKLFSGVEHYL